MREDSAGELVDWGSCPPEPQPEASDADWDDWAREMLAARRQELSEAEERAEYGQRAVARGQEALGRVIGEFPDLRLSESGPWRVEPAPPGPTG